MLDPTTVTMHTKEGTVTYQARFRKTSMRRHTFRPGLLAQQYNQTAALDVVWSFSSGMRRPHGLPSRGHDEISSIKPRDDMSSAIAFDGLLCRIFCGEMLNRSCGKSVLQRYSDEQKMTEFGRSSISEAFSNFSCSSLLPITFAAWLICRMSSCSRRKTRIRLPSNWSVS